MADPPPRSDRDGLSYPEDWSRRVEVITAIDGRVQQCRGRPVSAAGRAAPESGIPAHATGLRSSPSSQRPGSQICTSAKRLETRVFAVTVNCQSGGRSTRWRTTSSRSWPSTCSQGVADAGREDGELLYSRDPAVSDTLDEGRDLSGSPYRLSPDRSSDIAPRRGMSSGRFATCRCPETSGATAAPAAHRPRPAGVLACIPLISMPGCRPAD